MAADINAGGRLCIHIVVASIKCDVAVEVATGGRVCIRCSTLAEQFVSYGC